MRTASTRIPCTMQLVSRWLTSELALEEDEDRSDNEIVVEHVVSAKERRPVGQPIGEIGAAHEQPRTAERALRSPESAFERDFERAIQVPHAADRPRRRVIGVATDV